MSANPIIMQNGAVAAPAVRTRAEDAVHVQEVSPNDWDGLLSQFPDATVFHSLAWIRTLTRIYGLDQVLLQAEDVRGCAVLWPCLLMRKGPFRICGSPLPGWATPYLGPLVSGDTDPAPALAALAAHPALAKASFSACRTMIGALEPDLAPLGFRRRDRFETYVVTLDRSEDELSAAVASSHRRWIRKATRNGVTVERETDTGFIDDFWKMANEVFAKSGKKPTFPRGLLEVMWEELHPRGLLEVLSAMHEGRRIATIVLPHDDRRMYYWAGGSFAEHRRLGPNHLLQWQTILEARRLGLHAYDMISTMGGAGQFKKLFGPRAEHVATHWERSGSAISATVKNVYERIARRKARLLGWK